MKHGARPKPVEQAADDKLRHRGDREHHEGEGAERGGDVALWRAARVADSHRVTSCAMPCSRSSKILGNAKVVDWKMMLETAVVTNTITETRSSSAL